jgi:hypothetical protein
MKTILFSLAALSTLSVVAPNISSADQIKKISYECKGNTRTFIGPNEVADMEKGKKFSFETSGVAGAFDLRLGSNPSQPDLQITPIGKNLVRISLAEVVPVSVSSQSGGTISTGDTSSKIQHGFATEIRANGMGLSVNDGSGSEVISQWRDGFKGSVVIEAFDGSMKFGTADGKSLECKINID